MKKILVLGTGYPQNDLILACKNKRLEVHACSYIHGGIGEENADYFELIDIKDVNAVYEYAKRNSIDFIYSVGSDIAMPTVADVANRLGLPCFITLEMAETCNHKGSLREKMKLLPQWSVRSQIMTKKEEEVNISYPFIIKPSDSQGQRGVMLIRNREEYEMNFNNVMAYSSEKKVIIEEYVSGKEISVNVFLHDGKMVFSEISDRITWKDYEGGIIHKHRVPPRYATKKDKEDIAELIDDVIGLLKIKNGPVYFQIMLSNNGPKLIEVTPRLDGCHMWRLLEKYTGISLLKNTIDLLVDGEINTEVICPVNERKEYITEFICAQPNTTFKADIEAYSDAEFIEWYYKDGDIVREMNGKMEKCGYCIRSGDPKP